MPFDTHKYRGFDYYWRAASAFTACTALTTLFVYPFDTIHTRIAADLPQRGSPGFSPQPSTALIALTWMREE